MCTGMAGEFRITMNKYPANLAVFIFLWLPICSGYGATNRRRHGLVSTYGATNRHNNFHGRKHPVNIRFTILNYDHNCTYDVFCDNNHEWDDVL